MKKTKRTASFYQVPKRALLLSQPPTEFFSLVEAAQLLRVSPWTLRDRIRRGELHCFRIGRRVLLTKEQIYRFIQAQRSRQPGRPSHDEDPLP